MTLAIMQPYFLPYIGYWQLLASADRFVVYDNIKYTKQSWINRNRFLRDGEAVFFTLPLKHGSDALDIADRWLADDFDPAALLNPLTSTYRKAPFFAAVLPLLETILAAAPRNLFEFLLRSLRETAAFLDIRTPLIRSSEVAIDHGLKAQEKVLAICRTLGATRYVNAIGGQELYSAAAFAAHGVDLRFVQSHPIIYSQYDRPFVPSLSIVDVMMFNSRDMVRTMLGACDLV